MAMTAFEILGFLKLDKSDFDKGLSSAKKAGSALGTGASALTKGIAKAAKIGTVAVGAASAAAVGFGKSAVDAATSFESAFTGVKKTVDATEEEYNALSDWIMDASTKMASSKEDIASTMEIAGQLGVRGVKGLEKFTETMIKLGDTTNLDAEEAASALAKFGNIAGVSAEDMDRIGSVIVDLGNNFATTESDIVNMATRLASAGTIAGFSATDILGLSTAMSSVGIQAEAGGTAMSTIITKIGKSVDEGITPANKKLQTFAAVSGMSAEEFAKAWKKDPSIALSNFVTGLHGVVDNGGNVTEILETLGIKGIREANTIKSLALASDVMSSSIGTANKAFEENVALANEANTRYGTTESAVKQAAEAFSNLKVVIGKELTPIYGELMSFSKDAMNSLAEGFKEDGLSGLMKSLGKALSQAMRGLSEKLPEAVSLGVKLLSALGDGILSNLNVIINAAIDIVKILGEAVVKAAPSLVAASLIIVDDLLSAFDENFESIALTVEKLITGIGKAIMAHSGSVLEVAFSIIKKLIKALANAIPDFIGFVEDLIDDILSWIQDNIGTVFMLAVTIITKLAEGLTNALPVLLPTLVSIILSIVKTLTGSDSIQSIITAAINLIFALAEGFTTALPILIKEVPGIIETVVQTLMDNLPLLLDATMLLIEMLLQASLSNMNQIIAMGIQVVIAVLDGIISALPLISAAIPQLAIVTLAAIVKALPEFIKGGVMIIEAIISGLLSMVGSFISAGSLLIVELLKTITLAGSKLVEAGKSIIGFIKTGISNMIKDAKQWGIDMVQNFIDGITDSIGKLTKAAQKVAKTISKYIHFSEPDIGPLSNFHTFAPDMIDLFIKGLQDNTQRLQDQVAKSFDFGTVGTFDISSGNVSISRNNDVYNLLAEYLPQLSDQEMYLDGDTLVGGTINRMDRAMGNVASYAERGIVI